MEDKVKNIIKKYGSDKSFIVPILQDVQKEFNYLPKDALFSVSAHLSVPISRVYEVVTFYKAFSLKPKGRNQLSLCMGTACHVRGAELIASNVEDILGIKEGDTTADLEYSFETVGCLGACALGPVLVVNGEYHGHMNIAKSTKILKKLGKKGATNDEQD
ncbi:MAG: NAD(P)H-dependent oxidoreductase subunit E [Syntrophaceae bacterium]|nr:NAD(P)H-dependent oxidoreductase subunit E [Syntrophaceae bacterium]